jgi:hypothetical protein
VILAAGLLVLVGLGLFVAGILTGVTVLYWACVAACAVAAVLLIGVWRTMPRENAAAGATADRTTAEPPPSTAAEPAAGDAPATATAVTSAPAEAEGAPRDRPDPAVEEVEVTDLLIVVDLKDEVLVVDEHPRYHVAECSWLAGRETIPLPLDEARTDGFTPCAVCSPDRTLADRAKARKGTTAGSVRDARQPEA